MHTRSSSNLPVVSPPNPSTSNPKRRNHRRSKQPFIIEESPIDTMADQRTMAELLRAPIEGYVEETMVPPILAEQFELEHSLINMMTSDQFFGLEKDNPHDHIRAARRWLEKEPLHLFSLGRILFPNSSMNSFPLQEQQISVMKSQTFNNGLMNRFMRHEIDTKISIVYDLIMFQATPLPASIKAIEEICVPCGGAHPYYECLAAGGNTFPELRDNIQGYVAAAAINYNKGNSVYRHPALLSNKEKLQELENTPLNKNCSAVILKKLREKLGEPMKFLIPCGFNELKCKALDDLGASINLIPLSIWKMLGLPELISTRMTLEPANRAICTPARIARDVFVLVGKFTFPAEFAIVDYDKMILRDSDERLTLNMRHDTSSYSNQPQKESINLINFFNDSSGDFLEDLFSTNQTSGNPTFSSHPELTSSEVKNDIFDPEGGNILPEKLLDLDSTIDLHLPHHVNPLSGSTTYSSSLNHLREEFADELALITFPLEYDDDLQFDIDDNLVDSMPEMFADEHALDYSSPSLYHEYDDDLFKVETNTKNVYDDPFDSTREKIKESKLLIDEFDLPCDFLPSSKYDSFISEGFSKVDALPSTNIEDKVFNLGILIEENLFKVITHVAAEKKDKKLAISHASLMIEDFDYPLYELPFCKEVPTSKMLLLFSFENKEKLFKPDIPGFRRLMLKDFVLQSLFPQLY
nr:reverse transcriptase domain-containing protein [Tanacetum cinerariifolium]